MKKSIIGIILLIIILSLSCMNVFANSFPWWPPVVTAPVCTTAGVETLEITPEITETPIATIEPTIEPTPEITIEITPDITTTIEPTTTAVPAEEEKLPNTGESNPLILMVIGITMILTGTIVAVRLNLSKQK